MREPTLSLEALDAWRALLGKLNALGQSLCDAIESDDLPGAIATMMEMRRTRGALALVEAPALADGTEHEHAAMHEVALSVQGARASEAMMQQWLARPLPPQSELLASPIGIAVLADSILPQVWDFDVDLVILVGEALAPVAQLLIDVGQVRVIMVGANVRGAIEVATPAEVTLAIRSYPTAVRQIVIHTTGPSQLVDDVREAAEHAHGDQRIHRNTMLAFSKTWLAQALENLPAIAAAPSITAYDDAFVGKPMVIVAPGPSLAKNAHLLRELAGKAIITCFSHSLKPVLAAGVKPDLVVTVDPQDVQYHFAGCDTSELTFLNVASVHPALFRMPARRHITAAANGNADAWMFEAVDESPVVASGGSVATTTLSVALRWKCDPIIFVGLDLSFPGGKYYVSTSSDGDAHAEVDANGVMRVAGWSKGFHDMKSAGGPAAPRERVVELPGWHGDTVPSSFMFSLFHRWFEAEMAKQPAATVYNCTEGGCYIEGMSHIPLADAIATLPERFDAETALAAISAPSDRPAKFAAYLATTTRRIRRARKLAKRALGLVKSGASGPALTRVEKLLGETLRPLDFVSMLALTDVERAQDVGHRTATEATYLAASKELFEAIVRTTDELIPLIDSANDRISLVKETSHAK